MKTFLLAFLFAIPASAEVSIVPPKVSPQNSLMFQNVVTTMTISGGTLTVRGVDDTGFSVHTASGAKIDGCIRFGTDGSLQCVAPSTATILNVGNSGTSLNIHWSSSTIQYVTLTGNVTFTFSGGQSGGRYTLVLKQDGTGSRSVTWPSSVRHMGGTAPTLTTTASKTDYVGFIYNSLDSKYDLVSHAPNY